MGLAAAVGALRLLQQQQQLIAVRCLQNRLLSSSRGSSREQRPQCRMRLLRQGATLVRDSWTAMPLHSLLLQQQQREGVRLVRLNHQRCLMLQLQHQQQLLQR